MFHGDLLWAAFLKWVMMSQITPKHMSDNQILLKLKKIFNSTEINPNSIYPLSEPLWDALTNQAPTAE